MPDSQVKLMNCSTCTYKELDKDLEPCVSCSLSEFEVDGWGEVFWKEAIETARNLEKTLSEEAEEIWDVIPSVQELSKNKEFYLDSIVEGMLVAFRRNNNIVISGMIEKVDGEFLIVKTKNGTKFKIKKECVMWVKTGSRWPKGIYLALKGENRDVSKRSDTKGIPIGEEVKGDNRTDNGTQSNNTE